VAQHRIDDSEEREFFAGVPTALGLDEETVDRLVEIGRRLLRESEAFHELLTELRAPPLSESGRGDSSGHRVRFEPVREAEWAASLASSR
jgi:NTE family protein